MKDENALLINKIKELESDLEALRSKNQIYITHIENLKKDLSQMEQQNFRFSRPEDKKSEDDDVAHMKDLLIKFLNNVPLTDVHNE